jgi:hypothetical protein
MRKIMFAAFLFCFIQTYAKTPPIPEALLNAKTALAVNDGALAKDFDKLCKLLKEWGRFELVQDQGSANIIIKISTQVHYRNVQNPSVSGGISGMTRQEVLISYLRISDARDSSLLWSDETTDSQDPKQLVDKLKSKMKKK